MRPGRLPQDHPLEQQARAELRRKQGEKPADRDPARWAHERKPTQPRRWGTPDADPPVR